MLAGMETMSEACTNCGARLQGAYCSACGQAAYSRLTCGALLRDSVARFPGLDGGFLHTVVALTVRPGKSIGQCVDGRRRPLTPPVGYCCLLVTLYALTINLLDVEITVGELIVAAGLLEQLESFLA